jgi:biopolymer transport protein ExbD
MMQFKKRDVKRLSLDITPLIDVIFLLLIFFMISTTFPDSPGIKVNLPSAHTTTPPKMQKTLSVAITAQNKMYVEGVLVQRRKLKAAILKAKKKVREDMLVIRADGEVKHELVVFVMDTAKKAGIKKLSIATSREKNKLKK